MYIFPGPHILSERIIYSLRAVSSDTHSHDVMEFIHDSRRWCDFITYSPQAVISEIHYESYLYIGPSFPGPLILSGRIIYSHKAVTSDTHSPDVMEFIQDSHRWCDFITFSPQLPIYRAQLFGPPYSVGENHLFT